MRVFAVRAVGRVIGFAPCLLLPGVLGAQNPPQAPTIHVSTHLVQIGVVVRDKNGAVKDLTRDDFVILDRGKAQAIGVFSAEPGRAASTAQAAQPLPPNTFSDQVRNSGSESRSVTIVLLDNLNTLFGSDPQPYEKTPYWLEDHALAAARQKLMEFLKQMNPGDRIAIYGLTERLRVLCDFTCDRDQLLAVVGKYDATSGTARDSAEPSITQVSDMPDFSYGDQATVDTQALADINNQRRGEITMSALTAIAAHVADVPGRKNLLWLTANLPFSGEAVARVLARGNIVAYPVDARGLLPGAPVISMDDVDGDAYAEGKAGRPLGHTTVPVGIDTMVDMAADTGGHAFVNTNNIASAIRAVVEDAGGAYTLGFYLPAGEVDGKFHKLTVEVRRPELSLAYPRGYFAFKDTAASEDESHNSFLAAIRSPLDASAVPLQVKLNRVDQPQAQSLQIVGVVGIGNIRLPKDGDARRGAVDVYTIEQDAAGNVLHQANQRLNLKLTEPQYQAYLQSGILFHEVLQPEKGATVLRVLVQDPGTSEVGSVIIPLARVK
ncbi:MAG: VWA domain-containing protein [Acidobacteriaceae bacterium]